MSFTDINHFSISLSFSNWNVTGLQQVVRYHIGLYVTYRISWRPFWPHNVFVPLNRSTWEHSCCMYSRLVWRSHLQVRWRVSTRRWTVPLRLQLYLWCRQVTSVHLVALISGVVSLLQEGHSACKNLAPAISKRSCLRDLQATRPNLELSLENRPVKQKKTRIILVALLSFCGIWIWSLKT